LTPPPLDQSDTNAPAAARARVFANWLKSPEFTGGRRNLYVIDLFDLLAESDPNRRDVNMLRATYRIEAGGFRSRVGRTMLPAIQFVGLGERFGDFLQSGDAHPNTLANRTIAPVLAAGLDNAAHGFEAQQAG
jgi:hypothetical protein